MFCCRPSVTEIVEPIAKKEEPISKRPNGQALDGKKLISYHDKMKRKIDSEHLRDTLDRKINWVRPKVNHVISVPEKVHVKVGRMAPKQPGIYDVRSFHNLIGDSKYNRVDFPHRNQNSQISRSVSHKYKTLEIPRVKLNVSRSVSYRDPKTITTRMTSLDDGRWESMRQIPTRVSTEVTEHYKRSVTDSTVKEDTGSLSEEQRCAIEQLDDTLKDFNFGEPEDETPVIVTDILPYGVFEVNDKFDSGLESDEMPSSRNSSLSNKSVSSRTGIISDTKAKRERRLTSVSFKLPPDHVDKPYAPMQPNRNKVQAPIFTAIAMTDYKHTVVQSNNDLVYVEDKAHKRLSGPFKGSFKQLFYGKYAPKDLNANEKEIDRVNPDILEKVNSFESLNDARGLRGKR